MSSPFNSGFEVITVRSWSVLDATKPMFRAPPVKVFRPSNEIVATSYGVAVGENGASFLKRKEDLYVKKLSLRYSVAKVYDK